MRISIIVLSLSLALFPLKSTYSCTSFVIKTISNDPVYGRTMEWGAFDLKSELVAVPREKSFTSMLGNKRKGLAWQNKYGFVAINAMNKPFVTDGMNEKGLVVGVLYFPGFSEFQDFDLAQQSKTINNIDLAGYLLGNFSTIKDIKASLPRLRVVYNKELDKAFGAPSPLHLIVTEDSGKSIVIEYINKELHIHDNKIGVLTNAPSFDWHLLNLRNYPSLKPMGVTPGKSMDGVDISPFGAGSGMFGLPGDFTPTSRFIRVTAFTHSSVKLTSTDFAINQASRILNNFDIPKGVVREGNGDHSNKFHLNYTQWSVIADIR